MHSYAKKNWGVNLAEWNNDRIPKLRGTALFDSGVATCIIMESISRGIEPTYSVKDISALRKRFASDILSDSLCEVSKFA
jgi:hypothetical protein